MHLVLLAFVAVACKPAPPNAPEPTPDPAPAPVPVEAPAPAAEAEPLPDRPPGPGTQGTPCAEGDVCTGPPEGLTCVGYYGIAGPRGPRFTSCEIPCAEPGVTCPDGQTCTTVADGPGRVCRPARP